MSSRSPLTPTPQQAAVVGCAQRLLIVEANAGAAKTTTAALRVQEQLRRGTSPARILVLAYTLPGCQAMARALLRVGVPPAVAREVRIRSFDEFCARRLAHIEGPVTALKTPERIKPYVLEAIRYARDNLEERDEANFQIAGNGELAVEALLKAFQVIKGTMCLLEAGAEFRLTPQSADELGLDYTTLAVLRAFEHLRRGPLDRDVDRPSFRCEDDATYDMARMLVADDPAFDYASHPLALRLELIVVDEMHDLNRAMFTVLRGLIEANPQAAFVGVGDRDQVIHGEAGAQPRFMREGFDLEAGRATRLPLEASFRFGDGVARLLGRHARKPYASRAAWPSPVEIVPAASAFDLWLVIRRALEERPGLRRTSPPSELAILLRRPSRSVDLENQLLDKGIQYLTVGFDSYLRRPEVLFVRGVLAYALEAFDGIEVDEARRAVIHATMLFCQGSVLTTLDGVDEAQVAREREQVAAIATSGTFAATVMPRLLQQMTERPRHAIEHAVEIMRSDRVEDLPDAIRALDLPGFASRVLVHAAAIQAVQESVAGLVRAAAQFDSLRAFLRGTNQREVNLRAMSGRKERDCIRLSTIEAAKGLEFDHVIVPGVDAGEFDGDSAEPMNLFYVAASRARHLLTLAHTPGRPSAYLAARDAA